MLEVFKHLSCKHHQTHLQGKFEKYRKTYYGENLSCADDHMRCSWLPLALMKSAFPGNLALTALVHKCCEAPGMK